MKVTLAALVVLGVGGVAAASMYQNAARDREYRALLRRGDATFASGQTFGAIEAYSGALALRPDSMLAHLRRGETYSQRGDLESAARDFRTAAALDPSAPRPMEALGDVFYKLRRYGRAAEVYASRLRLDETSWQVTYKLARAKYAVGDREGAMDALRQAIRLNPDFPDAHYLLGVCHREKAEALDAIGAFTRAVTLKPTLVAAHEELADLFAARGRHAEAIEQLQLIATLDPENAERQVAVALAQARTGRGELAVVTLGSALERQANQPQLYAALGHVWLDMTAVRSDALTKALEALERVAYAPGASSATLTLYARALVKNAQLNAAQDVLQQAVARYPVDPEALLLHASVAEQLQHFDRARSALLVYDALDGEQSDRPLRAARIGALSLRLNDPAAAIDWLERALAGNPRDQRTLALLADASLQAGQLDRAREVITRGLENDATSSVFRALARRAR